MVDVNFIVNDLLCFLVFYLAKLEVKLVKQTIFDFYSPAAVNGAKERLAEDVAALGVSNVPRLPTRRGTTEKQRNEIEDIFALM